MNARPHGREVFFVGSIALPNAATVFETVGRTFGSAVRRIPDGETGNRLGWMEWQTPLLAANALLEAIPSEGDWRNPTAPDRWKHRTWFRLRPDADAGALQLGDIGYAGNAVASYREFAQLKSKGVIAAGVRFMVAIPSPFNLINFHFASDQRAAVEPAYEAALLAEVDQIVDAIPHAELSIQWDCAHDMQAYDGAREAWFSDKQSGRFARVARIQTGQIFGDPAVETDGLFCNLSSAHNPPGAGCGTELRPVERHQPRREQALIPAEQHKSPACPHDRCAVVAAKVRNRLEVGCQPTQKPHHLDIARTAARQSR